MYNTQFLLGPKRLGCICNMHENYNEYLWDVNLKNVLIVFNACVNYFKDVY